MLVNIKKNGVLMLAERHTRLHPSLMVKKPVCSIRTKNSGSLGRSRQQNNQRLGALPAFNEAAELAAGGHVDVATAEGLLKSIPTDPDAIWNHLQHHSIGLSSVAGFFDTLSTSLQGHPLPHDSLPLASMNLDFLQLDGDYMTPDVAFSEVYMPPADLQTFTHAASQLHNGIAISAVADQSSQFLDSAAAISDPTALPAILQGLPDAASWAATASAGEAVSSLADAAQSSPAAAYLNDLAVWAANKLNVIQFVDPASFEDIRCSMAQLVDALQSTISIEAEREAQNVTNALVLSMQQIAAAIALPLPGGVSSISGMAAAQEAVTTTTGMVRLEELMKIALGVVAMIIAAIPRNAEADAIADDSDDAIPLRYDPEGLADYFSRRPVLVMQRNAVVVGKMTGLLANLLLDWQTGRIRENMPLRAKQLRVAAEELGPAYIKIAQAMSTRVDMVPEPYLVEFAKLQDNVAPFCTAEARVVLEQSLGRPVDQIFEWMSEEPLAAASLGQVYRGKLREAYGGCEVAVKVQRPRVLESVSLDIFIMRRAAAIFSKLPGMNDQWSHVLDDWAMRFFMEMDYQLEAQNTTTFRLQMEERNLKAIKVAEVHPDLVSRKVIVTEWLQGEKLSESSAADVRALCSTLLNCYLIQLLETGFLHADPHPGNLLRTPDGHIAILDFGLMTEVTEEQRVLLVEFIAHLTLNDWEAISRDLEGFGFFPDGLSEEVRPQVIPILEKVMSVLINGGGLAKGFSITAITAQLDNVARNFQMVVPPYFGLILRAFSTIEGIALRVDPKYAIVQECLPYLSQRLFTDTNPRMKAALREMLYGDKKRVDIARLQKLVTAVGDFSTSPEPQAMGPTISSMYGERVKGRAPPPEDDEPVLSDGVKEALKVVFSPKGSFVQELVVEEMVATVDAMSKEALGEALKMVLSSASAVATLRSMESLGPLRMMLMPVPLPMEYLSSMQPRVQLSDDDRQALLLFRTVLDLLQPAVIGMPFAAANGRQAVRVAGELVPLMPELLPGIQHTAELFMKAMMRRVALRIADDLDPNSAPIPSRKASAQFEAQQQYYQGIQDEQQLRTNFRSPHQSHHHHHHQHNQQKSRPAAPDSYRRY